MRLRVGSGLPNIQKPALADFRLDIPPERTEQAAIAEVLAEMDAEIAMLEQRREKTRGLKQAMIQELLTGKTRLVPAEAAHA
jgi:type I restriction enzyme, S subunit